MMAALKNDMASKTRGLEEVVSGARKHNSLADAALYAAVMEDKGTADFLSGQLEKRNQLIKRLVLLNAESGGSLLPGVPGENSLAAFMAIEDLAAKNPQIHPMLGQIDELDKTRFMVGHQGAAQH